jgi:hypothetical protein
VEKVVHPFRSIFAPTRVATTLGMLPRRPMTEVSLNSISYTRSMGAGDAKCVDYLTTTQDFDVAIPLGGPALRILATDRLELSSLGTYGSGPYVNWRFLYSIKIGNYFVPRTIDVRRGPCFSLHHVRDSLIEAIANLDQRGLDFC